MLKWEAALFHKGAGCPCCEGEGDFEPQTISDVEYGDLDPMIRINQFENRANRPKWEQPAPKVLWKCSHCEQSVQRDPDYNELEYTKPCHYFQTSPIDKPAYTFGDNTYCHDCVNECENCGDPIEPETGHHRQEGMSVHYFCSDECVGKHEHEATIENIGNAGCSLTIDDLPEDWREQCFSWFWDNNQSAIECCDGSGGYPSDEEMHECLAALGFLESEEDDED
jgi:hypothetical protein